MPTLRGSHNDSFLVPFPFFIKIDTEMEMVFANTIRKTKTEYVSVSTTESEGDDDDVSVESEATENSDGLVPRSSALFGGWVGLDCLLDQQGPLWIGVGSFLLTAATVFFFIFSGKQVKEEEGTTISSSLAPADQCSFRQYPPHRFYGVNRTNEILFLHETKYLWGTYPSLLPVTRTFKICADQTEWQQGTVPFADGTNPTVLSIERLRKHLPKEHEILAFMEHKGAHYLGSLTFKNIMACEFPFPDPRTEPEAMRTLLVLLDEHMQTITQTTMQLELDSDLGWRNRTKIGDSFERQTLIFDDARLFVHGKEVWVSFKNYQSGPLITQVQVFSPLKFETNQQSWSAIIPASESRYVCCGRNMGVLEEPGTVDDHVLFPLKHMDTIDPVNISSHLMRNNDLPEKKKFLPYPPDPIKYGKYLHGTTGMLLHLPDRGEYVGILHQHRPHKKGEKDGVDYAPFGHHYSHTFFTVTDKAPHKLTRMSKEFLFPAQTREFKNDAENIQFASGLDIVERDGKEYVLISYGIGDCEGAVVEVEWSIVEEMLLPTGGDRGPRDFFKKPKNHR